MLDGNKSVRRRFYFIEKESEMLMRENYSTFILQVSWVEYSGDQFYRE